jgi:lysophospholipase L1-like esterase
LARFRTAAAQSKTRPVAVVAAESSTTGGYNATSTDLAHVGWLTKLLQAEYPSGLNTETPSSRVTATVRTQPGIHMYNAGVGGTTSGKFLSAEAIQRIGAIKPDLVIVMVGANDRVNNVPPETYKSNVLAAVTAINNASGQHPVYALVHQYPRWDV